MTTLALPADVLDVFKQFPTCEFTTVMKDGTPNTWPLAPLYLPDEGRFLLSSSIGASSKLAHIRRNPRVAMLFSEPRASGLTHPATVLVQGDAEAPERIFTAFSEDANYRNHIKRIFTMQPAGTLYSMNAITRALFDWYYMRVPIYVTPRRILWWPNGDQTGPAQIVEGV